MGGLGYPLQLEAFVLINTNGVKLAGLNVGEVILVSAGRYNISFPTIGPDVEFLPIVQHLSTTIGQTRINPSPVINVAQRTIEVQWFTPSPITALNTRFALILYRMPANSYTSV